MIYVDTENVRLTGPITIIAKEIIMKPITLQELEAAYLAGFMASSVGNNGEYPYTDNKQSPETDSDWLQKRAQYLSKLLTD